MYYDKNGTIIVDLDRGICAIRNNLLNLPDTIQFTNGNQIINSYDAMGRKRSTIYRTLTTPTVVPVGAMELIYGSPGTYWKFHTPVGYSMADDLSDDPRYYYYVQDHLGNVCAVWSSESNSFEQQTFYYPSGVPMSKSSGPALQPNKFGGKPYEEMHGFDCYEYEFRNYYATIMRFTAMDPLCEQTPWQSPYVYAANNPVCNIDWMGLASTGLSQFPYGTYSCIIINRDGTLKDLIDDKDDSIYLDENGTWRRGDSKDRLKKVGRFFWGWSYEKYVEWYHQQLQKGGSLKVQGRYDGQYSWSININVGVVGSLEVFDVGIDLNLLSFNALSIAYHKTEESPFEISYMGKNNRICITQSISIFGITILGQTFDIFASSFNLAGNEKVVANDHIWYDLDSGVMYGSFSIGAIITIDITFSGDMYYHYTPQ